MKIHNNCLPCLINQVVKVAEMTGADDQEILFKKVFRRLGDLDFTETNPEIIGMTFELLKEHIGNSDPYGEIRLYYNKLFLSMMDTFASKIDSAPNPFKQAVLYAIMGNIIDFNPIHNSSMEDIMQQFADADKVSLTVDHLDQMASDLKNSKKLLYLGDNCGEICLDKLLLREIKRRNPCTQIYFGVRGTPVVNDSIEADAYFVGIDEYATIIGNGDNSLGTVLCRTSDEFRQIYGEADVIIAKGQANYESLSEEHEKNIYFLLVTKCDVIAKDIGVAIKSYICMNQLLRPSAQIAK